MVGCLLIPFFEISAMTTLHPARTRFVVLCLALAAGMAGAQGVGTSLYERLGGRDKIAAAANEIVDAVSHDARTKRTFDGIKLAPLKLMVADHLCAVAGGPCTYRGETMTVAHTGLAITDEEFDVMGSFVDAAFAHQGVAIVDRRELEALLTLMRREVVGK